MATVTYLTPKPRKTHLWLDIKAVTSMQALKSGCVFLKHGKSQSSGQIMKNKKPVHIEIQCFWRTPHTFSASRGEALMKPT